MKKVLPHILLLGKAYKNQILYGFFSLLIILVSCIEIFDYKSPRPTELLNIEGYLSTELKIQQIRLSRAAKFGPEFVGANYSELLATVFLKDDLGQIWEYLEEGNGIYKTTKPVAAEFGRAYVLEIRTKSGEHFISLPEQATPVPEVDTIVYEATKSATNNPLIDEIGVKVWAYFRDPPGENNYYYWPSQEAIYILYSNPEDYHTPRTSTTCANCPAPKDCCSRCFRRDRPLPNRIFSTDDSDFDGLYRGHEIAYIWDDGYRFRESYRLDLKHMSVSKNAQRFLKLADQQLRLTGSVFDPPPANIRGNFIGLHENADPQAVLGYFFVADEIPLRVYIKFQNLEFTKRPFGYIPDDCRVSQRVIPARPDDWED